MIEDMFTALTLPATLYGMVAIGAFAEGVRAVIRETTKRRARGVATGIAVILALLLFILHAIFWPVLLGAAAARLREGGEG